MCASSNSADKKRVPFRTIGWYPMEHVEHVSASGLLRFHPACHNRYYAVTLNTTAAQFCSST